MFIPCIGEIFLINIILFFLIDKNLHIFIRFFLDKMYKKFPSGGLTEADFIQAFNGDPSEGESKSNDYLKLIFKAMDQDGSGAYIILLIIHRRKKWKEFRLNVYILKAFILKFCYFHYFRRKDAFQYLCYFCINFIV